jgi:hypothetical protein
MATLTFVPAASSGVEVSEEVVKEIEDSYEFLRTHPDMKGQAKFATRDERLAWLRQVRAYCAGREEGKLTFRLLPDKGKALAENEFYFRVTADLPGNGARNDITHA